MRAGAKPTNKTSTDKARKAASAEIRQRLAGLDAAETNGAVLDTSTADAPHDRRRRRGGRDVATRRGG